MSEYHVAGNQLKNQNLDFSWSDLDKHNRKNSSKDRNGIYIWELALGSIKNFP